MSDPQSAAASAHTDPDLSARRLGDYHLLRLLGRGGMADVYLAEQGSLGRRVAFKVLKGSLAKDESYVRRFLHEAKAAASLVHANIVQIYEVGCIDGVHFIAQEYVDGRNLKQLLDRHGAMNIAAAVNVMRQVAAALHKAGQQKITHRDIKPENIMLSADGEVKVADFGLARVEREGKSVNLTQVGMTMGTPMYMSPEQVEGRPVDTRSDIYSFGVTCYCMLAGHPPFSGDTPLAIAIQHLNREPQRLEDVRSDVPEGLCRIIHKMMAKAPEDRYQNAAELLRDLRTLQIEGVDEEWPSGIDEWNTPELLALADARTEATLKLHAVMKSEAMTHGRRGAVVWIAAAVLTALILGGLTAWATRPASLLDVDEHEVPQVERQGTVRDQYLHAAQIATEEAWESVSRYFPPEGSEQNKYYTLRAKQRLAEFYLENDQPDRAMEHYSDLVEADDADAQFRAIGLLGQANVLMLRGEHEQAKQKLLALVPLSDELPVGLRQLLIMELNPRLRLEFESLRREVGPGSSQSRNRDPP
jgi:serine/threonine-protein kinase